MSSKSFVKVLRKIIREEVRSAVKEILTEQKPNHNKVMSHGMNLSEQASNPRRPKKQFSKNSMLNDILNETSGLSADGPLVTQDYPSMGSFKSDMADSVGMTSQPQQLATTGINGEAVNMQNENVVKTLDVMTRDYSGLMKAIDKKKNR